jgi:sugar lactone lactonase YvrE
MHKGTTLFLLAGALACAGIVARRGCATVPRGGAARGGDRTVEARISAYDAQIAALGVIDAAQILYREAQPLAPAGLTVLRAIAVGPDDRIYAGGGSHLVVLSPQGETLRSQTLDGDISCLAVDATGRLYAGLGAAVHAFDAEGRPTATFADIGTNAIITSLAAAGDDVFAADARSLTVLRYAPGGVLKNTINGRQGQPEELGFIVPSPYFDLMLGQGDTLWVVNPGRHRLEEYAFTGERIGAWPERPGTGIENFCGCCNPVHVARLADGSIVTSEKGLSRVKVYATRGGFTGVVAAPDLFDSADAGLDLAVDSKGRILVSDAARLQIRVFELKEGKSP